MRNLTNNELEILELFNLTSDAVDSVRYENLNGNAVLHIKLEESRESCPSCNCEHPKVKGYTLKKINHSILSDRKCTIFYNQRRYVCPVCKRTYNEHNPFSFGAMKLSAKTVMNVLEDLKKHTETFSSVARRYHISPTTVANIFDQHVNVPRRVLPEIINFDEVYAFRSARSKYVCILLDFKTRNPIDALNSRRIEDLQRYFYSIPKEERDKVKICCSDMYEGYRTVVRTCLPQARLVCDRFHVVQEMNRKVDQVRIKVMKDQSEKDKQLKDKKYYLLKKFNWMIYKNDNVRIDGKSLFDPNVEKKYSRKLKEYVNYYDIREMLRNCDDRLLEAWTLKENVIDFFRESNEENALNDLNELIKLFSASSLPEMIGFGKLLYKWRIEIVNSFFVQYYAYKVNKDTGEVETTEVKVSNGIIENRNSIAKILKKNSNGYHNWERFRNRLLYVLDSDVTYQLYPIKKKKK